MHQKRLKRIVSTQVRARRPQTTAEALLLASLLLIQPARQVRSAVTVSEHPVSELEGGTRITVKNEYFEIELVPLGAQAVSFRTCYSDRPWLWRGGQGIRDSGHLFMDNFLGQVSPQGELCFIKHGYDTVQRGPEKVEIRFQALTKEKLQLEKTFAFESGSPVVRVKLSLTNQSKEVITHGLWPKSDVHLSGLRERNYYYRPYERGVMITGWNAQKQRNEGEDFLRTPYEGWTAAIQADQREGLVWLMDYNWLRCLYNCHVYWTVEWFYDDLPLPPGKTWATEYAMILVKNLSNVVHACPAAIAGMTIEGKDSLVCVTHTLSRSLLGDLKGVKLSATLREVDSDAVHDLPDLAIGNLTWQAAARSQELKVNPKVRLACAATLTATGPDGKPVTDSYEYYWPGMGGEKFNLAAGTNVSTYYRKPPRKVKEYSKPKDLRYVLNVPVRALEFRGPGYSKLHVMEAAAKAGISEFLGSYFSSDWSGGKCTRVPTSSEEMFSYDLLILDGVDAQSLTDFGLEAARDFVEAGGSLLAIGGFYVYGPGGYAGTPLGEVLPVKLSQQVPGFERISPPAPLRVAAGARCLRKARWGAAPLCFWLHQLTPKEHSWVELTAAGRPFLVCGTYGKGRVAAIASSALGNPRRGQIAFWEDSAWPENLSRVIKWLVFGEEN